MSNHTFRFAAGSLVRCLAPQAAKVPALRLYSTAPASNTDTLFSKLKQDLKASMRSKDQARLAVIRSILSDITYREKDYLSKGEPEDACKAQAQTDTSVTELIQRAQKKRRDSAELYATNDRSDLADKERAELAILSSFLPEPLSDQEVEAHVLATIKSCNATTIKDLGAVIRAVTLDPARAPKAKVAETAKRLLVGARPSAS